MFDLHSFVGGLITFPAIVMLAWLLGFLSFGKSRRASWPYVVVHRATGKAVWSTRAPDANHALMEAVFNGKVPLDDYKSYVARPDAPKES